MLKKIQSKKELWSISAVATAVLYMIGHGYRFFNSGFSGDSLLMLYQNDSAWQISIGRVFQPFLIMFRGGIVSPFLISVLSILWLTLAVYFLVDYLEIKNKLSVFLVVAVMTCNAPFMVANSTFLPFMDFYALALLAAVLGVWLLKKKNWICTIFGAGLLCISLGIYQAYVCVAIAMVMIHFLLKMLEPASFMKEFKSLLIHLAAFIVAAIVYYAIWKVFQGVFGIWTANTYNGLSAMGDYTDSSIVSILGLTYRNVFEYFANPDVFITMPFHGQSLSIVWVYVLRFCNVAVVLLILASLVFINVKNKTAWWQRVIQVLILVVFPLGINFVCVISKGMEHTLMMYAFGLVYILGIKTTECGFGVKMDKRCIPYVAALMMVLIVSWSNIVYSNQIYLKKDLQDKATHSMMTRIVYEIESTEGYVSGETPVAFCGSFENTDYVPNMEAFKDIVPYGTGKSALTYVGTDYAYLTYILNTNMNLTRIESENQTVKQMPCYPAEGSVAFVDGVLVVKISD